MKILERTSPIFFGAQPCENASMTIKDHHRMVWRHTSCDHLRSASRVGRPLGDLFTITTAAAAAAAAAAAVAVAVAFAVAAQGRRRRHGPPDYIQIPLRYHEYIYVYIYIYIYIYTIIYL